MKEDYRRITEVYEQRLLDLMADENYSMKPMLFSQIKILSDFENINVLIDQKSKDEKMQQFIELMEHEKPGLSRTVLFYCKGEPIAIGCMNMTFDPIPGEQVQKLSFKYQSDFENYYNN